MNMTNCPIVIHVVDGNASAFQDLMHDTLRTGFDAFVHHFSPPTRARQPFLVLAPDVRAG